MFTSYKDMFFLISVISFSFVTLCCAHVCLLSPTQRGKFHADLNKPASADCIRLDSPCGKLPPTNPPETALCAGCNITLVFQKNLDHYNKDRPGYFSIKLGPNQDNLVEVQRIPDDWHPSLTLYMPVITAPKNPGYYVMQVEYFPNNASAPPAFYQCSDFLVFPPIGATSRRARPVTYDRRNDHL